MLFFFCFFLVSLVENVYFAFLGSSVRTAFSEGVEKRGFSSTLLDLGFGDFLAFGRLITKSLFYRVFGWSPLFE